MAGKAEYKNQWARENVDRISVIVPKGQKQILQARAASVGQSLNAYILEAVQDRMDIEDAQRRVYSEQDAIKANSGE